MIEIAQDIVDVIGDYHNDQDFHFTSTHVIDWVNQFDAADRQFILEEFRHVLNQDIYVSKAKAAELLRKSLIGMSQHFKYGTVQEFLFDSKFLNLQPAPKSQGELLIILEEILEQDHNLMIAQCGVNNPKNFVYYDDLLATGGTISRITNGWLSSNHQNGQPNFTLVNKGQIRFIICVFCSHSWGIQTCKWLWKFKLNNDEIMKSVKVFSHYVIENQVGVPSERLNLPYPLSSQPQNVKDYLRELPATADRHESKALRTAIQPAAETFFSSSGNRVRFENILLQKGIEILGRVADKNKAHRPLGATFPSYRTFGTGTLYFTWRNISNTTPIVFWWQGHSWHGLFPLRNRGGM
jgi:hypothetical protein